MTITAAGLDPLTSRLLVAPVPEAEFAAALLGSLPQRGAEVRALTKASALGTTFRGLAERRPTTDLGDPRQAGWTYLMAADDPQRDEIARIIRPLAIHRGMKDPARPLLFSGNPWDEWMDWMLECYWSVEADPPRYVLIVGGPDRVPFHFQAVLDSAASVGRVAFDDLGDLDTYVQKVLRLESGGGPAVRPEALVFATDSGRPDPTYYSRRYMAQPIEDRIRNLGVVSTMLAGERATADEFLTALTTSRPALVYTASHGAGRPGAPIEDQRRVNGAMVCQGGALIAATNVPDAPFAEGAVVFQFACFSAGTPRESDYAHWLGQDVLNAEADFIAALPAKLLAHPRGPVAFIGHVDLAWLHAFDDPEAPDLIEAWHPRLAPFVSAVETLLAPQPVGLAMQAMNKRYDVGNAQLVSTFERQKRGTLPDNPAVYHKLVQAFITRSDAQNYIVLGDPAVYPRMSDD